MPRIGRLDFLWLGSQDIKETLTFNWKWLSTDVWVTPLPTDQVDFDFRLSPACEIWRMAESHALIANRDRHLLSRQCVENESNTTRKIDTNISMISILTKALLCSPIRAFQRRGHCLATDSLQDPGFSASSASIETYYLHNYSQFAAFRSNSYLSSTSPSLLINHQMGKWNMAWCRQFLYCSSTLTWTQIEHFVMYPSPDFWLSANLIAGFEGALSTDKLRDFATEKSLKVRFLFDFVDASALQRHSLFWDRSN